MSDEQASAELKPAKLRSSIGRAPAGKPKHPYLPVAEDIEWLRDEWTRRDEQPSSAALRRGSGTLRLLLRESAIQKAWRHCGLPGRPSIVGPDLEALARHHGHELRHAASAIAGGAVLHDIHFSMIGAWRAENPTSGVSANADEGFAVVTTYIARDAHGPATQGPIDALVQREWKLDAYLDAPGAIRRGKVISRRSIIEFFAHYEGGVHLDRVMLNGKKRALYEFVAELDSKVMVDTADGLYFELLSIGQAIGTSPALLQLAAAIRAGAPA